MGLARAFSCLEPMSEIVFRLVTPDAVHQLDHESADLFLEMARILAREFPYNGCPALKFEMSTDVRERLEIQSAEVWNGMILNSRCAPRMSPGYQGVPVEIIS